MFIFCRKKPDLLTFNTGATKICANVKKNELRVFAKVLGVDVKWLLNEECS